MHKQAIQHKQAIIGGGYLFTENACFFTNDKQNVVVKNIFMFLNLVWRKRSFKMSE